MSATADFTHPCQDCGRTIRVARGRTRWHWCRMPRALRGRMGRAYADGMRWACTQAGHPRQQPGDLACICETWARWVELGFLRVDAPSRKGR